MKSIYFIIICLIVTGFIVSPLIHCSDRLITDQLGRSVRVPDDPKRIISLAPNITEIIFALNQGYRLVGAASFSDYPPQAVLLPKVGSYVNPDIEKIVSLKPDLCIATKDGNPIEIVSLLESLNIPVYAVDPRNLSAVMATINEIGSLLGAKNTAEKLFKDMQVRIKRVTDMVKTTKSRPGVFYQIGLSPIVSAGTNTCINELIEMAGGNNLAKGATPYPRFSAEQVIGLSPELFIITSMAGAESFENARAEWRKWPEIPAVKNNRILLLDSNLLDRPSPRLVDGLEMLVKAIHPEIFEKGFK